MEFKSLHRVEKLGVLLNVIDELDNPADDPLDLDNLSHLHDSMIGWQNGVHSDECHFCRACFWGEVLDNGNCLALALNVKENNQKRKQIAFIVSGDDVIDDVWYSIADRFISEVERLGLI